ncbi:MAG: Rrf2 family transcriptional regulator [Alphaproteobacteria bacterium]|nr:Rrf2 family transcriptional regulator [Rhodospirillales bacterium]MDE2465667.1 Rrf2 family transcriptional regulator [Alphaproteobacteria bacterium]
MRLTLWTDYALRTLIFVGAKGRQFATIAEIAKSFDVPKTHLMKVVNRLGQLGYLETVRGKGGGVRLGRPPLEIVVGAVVRETEEDLAVMGCLGRTGFCRIEACCVLRGALHQATQAFLTTLDGYTLADLLAPRARLVQSLGIAPVKIRRSALGFVPE